MTAPQTHGIPGPDGVVRSLARGATKSAEAFRTISEVADDLEVPQHVLRFWESKFPQVKPLKRAGGRRYYRPQDVALLRCIRQCLYEQGYTIRGVQKLLREGGIKGDLPLPVAVPAMPPAAPAAERRAPAEARSQKIEGRELLIELRRELVELRDMLRRAQR